MRTSGQHGQNEIGRLLSRLRRLRLTYQLTRLVLIVIGCASIALAIAGFFAPGISAWVVSLVGIAAAAWGATGVEWNPSLQRMALIADRQLDLKERLSTAIEASPEVPEVLSRALANDAAKAAAGADVSVLHPLMRQTLIAPVILAAAGLVLMPLSLTFRPAEGVAEQMVSGIIEGVAELAQGGVTPPAEPEPTLAVAEAEAGSVPQERAPSPEAAGERAADRNDLASSFTEAGAQSDAGAGASVEEGGLPLKDSGTTSSGPRKENPYATGHGTQSNTATGGEVSATPPGQDPGASEDVRTVSVPGGADTGESLGLPPPPNLSQADALTEEGGKPHSVDAPPMSGLAEGAGESGSNMAGSGSGPDSGTAELTVLTTAGFSDAQVLEANALADGSRIRESEATEAAWTDAQTSIEQTQWPKLAPVELGRVVVPEAARGAVENYFNRPDYAP